MTVRVILGTVTSILCIMAQAVEPVLTTPKLGEAFPIPDKYELVNDYHGALSFAKVQKLTSKLRALERRNGTQIVILIIPSTGGEGVESYSLRVAEKWDIGNNGQGNGVLFMVEAKGGRAFIRTGPGISGALPDVKVRRIFAEQIEPHWQRKEFSAGVEAGVDAMILAAKGEDTAKTFYDYSYFPYQPKFEHIGITLLSLFGIGYAGVLLWKRRKRPKVGESQS
jgi:uncharacterized protein